MRYASSTNGGGFAHVVRRIIHVLIILIPIFYYYFLLPLFSKTQLTIGLIAFLCLIMLFEFVRVHFRIVLFAQRLHEATHFSAFGWTMLSICFIFLLSPLPAYSFAIIISCALADPLLGELRAKQVEKWKVVIAGVCVVLIVWLAIAYLYHIAYAWAFLMAPLTVAVEWPSLKWIDDNALMLLVPLLIVSLTSI